MRGALTLEGEVAVVTGAASGIGRGLAQQAARRGMKVVLADVEEQALRVAEAELRSGGASVLAVRTDVSRREEVEARASEVQTVARQQHSDLERP